jgi:2-keto-3-deoxy-L-fuconate dehydrogenase
MGRLQGQRVVITQADDYMGPAISRLFADEGAEIIECRGHLDTPAAVDAVLAQCSDIDVLVANLAHKPLGASVESIVDDDWQRLFATMVTPLMQLVRGVTPAMKSRGGGRIVAVTSAAPLRGIPNFSSYCASRGAQNAFVRAAGLELAPFNIQFNAVGQNYVSNEEYYPPEQVATEKFQRHLKNNVPSNRLAESSESAELALFLASGASRHMVGQVVPFAGGWATQ